jgi:HK97 gp10 family phage protein
MASELLGVSELIGKLNEFGAATAGKELRAIARTAMKVVHDKAQAAIPVGTVPHKTYKGRRVFGGFAKRTLRLLAYINKRTGSAEALVGPSREAYYASLFVELGTSKMAARPWLRPALRSSESDVLKVIAEQLRIRVKRIAGRQRRFTKRTGLIRFS